MAIFFSRVSCQSEEPHYHSSHDVQPEPSQYSIEDDPAAADGQPALDFIGGLGRICVWQSGPDPGGGGPAAGNESYQDVHIKDDATGVAGRGDFNV